MVSALTTLSKHYVRTIIIIIIIIIIMIIKNEMWGCIPSSCRNVLFSLAFMRDRI